MLSNSKRLYTTLGKKIYHFLPFQLLKIEHRNTEPMNIVMNIFTKAVQSPFTKKSQIVIAL